MERQRMIRLGIVLAVVGCMACAIYFWWYLGLLALLYLISWLSAWPDTLVWLLISLMVLWPLIIGALIATAAWWIYRARKDEGNSNVAEPQS